jgi:hypothetical protein
MRKTYQGSWHAEEPATSSARQQWLTSWEASLRIVCDDRARSGDLDDMSRVTINSGGCGVGSWDVRRCWFRGRARGGASRSYIRRQLCTITRAGRQALSLFRREGTTQTPLCTRPDIVFLPGAIVSWLCRFFHCEMIDSRICARAKSVSFARFCSPRRGLRSSPARSASFELLVMHLCFRLRNYTLYYFVLISHRSISLVVAVIATATMVGTTKSGGFSGGQLLLAS